MLVSWWSLGWSIWPAYLWPTVVFPFQPPGSCNRLPEVICVVSACDALGFYEALLVAAERRRCVSLDHASHLLQAAYAKPLPAPGQDTYIRALAKNDRLDTLTLTRPRDACCSDVSPSTQMRSHQVMMKSWWFVVGLLWLTSDTSSCGHAASCVCFGVAGATGHLPGATSQVRMGMRVSWVTILGNAINKSIYVLRLQLPNGSFILS